MPELNVAYVMDPIAGINIEKDSTFAMMEEAQARGFQNYYLQPKDLFVKNQQVWGKMQRVRVARRMDFYALDPVETLPLSSLSAVHMRKDPAFDMDYIFTTYVLEMAAEQTLVLNNPRSLRNLNEKLYPLRFASLVPDTLVSCDRDELRAFVRDVQHAVIKPLDEKGGTGVFLVRAGDVNLNGLLDMSTHLGTRLIIAQRYIPEATQGDKRILLFNGEPRGGFKRVPSADDHRANMAAGGKAKPTELNERDLEICATIGPSLREQGLYFVGIDIIGDYLIEINITSPTGIQEVKKFDQINLAADINDFIAQSTGG